MFKEGMARLAVQRQERAESIKMMGMVGMGRGGGKGKWLLLAACCCGGVELEGWEGVALGASVPVQLTQFFSIHEDS